MKKFLFFVLAVLALFSCSNNDNIMIVSGDIDGLKKGWLYLQKLSDSALVNIDSLEIRGDGAFTLRSEITTPEMFYLYLNKADNNDMNDRIAFFGEKGEININTSWNQFENNAEINGSETQEDYREYIEMMSNFNKMDLELAQATFVETDSVKVDSLEALAERNYLTRYRYILNFALTNPNSYVTPYITITDGLELNPEYLDSIYKTLPDSVAQSKYGKRLSKIVNKN
ncbi:MAG: DUF4369 domain-containing protein [Croceivirga sp.]